MNQECSLWILGAKPTNHRTHLGFSLYLWLNDALISCKITYACKGRLWLYAAPLGMLLDVFAVYPVCHIAGGPKFFSCELKSQSHITIWAICEHCQEQYMGIWACIGYTIHNVALSPSLGYFFISLYTDIYIKFINSLHIILF